MAITAIPARRHVRPANSRKRDRSDIISSAESNHAYDTQPEMSPTEPDSIGDAGKQVCAILSENFTTADM